MKKATNVEIANRVSKVIDLLIQGAQREDITQFCTNEYNIKQRQIDEYIKKATSVIMEQVSKDREYNIALSISRYNRLFAKNYRVQDFRECRNVQLAMDKLLGLQKHVAVQSEPEQASQQSKLAALKPKRKAN